MQIYTIFFITLNALHVSGGFSVRHRELKNCTHSIRYMSSLLAASVGEFQLTHASGNSKQAWHIPELTHASGNRKEAWHIPDAVCTVFELLMMGGETA